MADRILEDLEKAKKVAQESADDYDKAVTFAKEIASLKKLKDDSQKKITSYLNESRSDVGTMGRLGAALGGIAPIDAVYKLNQDLNEMKIANNSLMGVMSELTKVKQNFEDNYAKSIGKNVLTAATGKNYNKGQKTYSDIIYDQMGATKVKGKLQLADVAGFAGDVATDPGMIVNPVTIAYKALAATSSKALTIAARAPKMAALIDSVGRNLDVFYDTSKAYSNSTMLAIKDAFREAASSKDFSKLRALGLDVSDYVKKGIGYVEEPALTNTQKSIYDLAGQSTKGKTAAEIAAIDQARKQANTIQTNQRNIYQGNAPLGGTVGNLTSPTGMNASKAPLEKLLKDVFDPIQVQTQGIVGYAAKGVSTALEVTNAGYKKVMSMSPVFWSRNIIGATIQNVMEYSAKEIFNGTMLKEAGQAWKMVRTEGTDKAGNVSALWTQMKKGGQIGIEGITGEGGIGLAKKFGVLSENFQRTVSVLRETRLGKTPEEAIAKTSDVLYNYNVKYLTPFLQSVGKAVPYLTYNLGQLRYMPDAFSRLAAKWNVRSTLKRDTESSAEKDYPEKKQPFKSDMATIGPVGGLGYQDEGFWQLATGNMKAWWSQLAPLLTGTTELIAGYNVYKGQAITKDKDTSKLGGGSLTPNSPWTGNDDVNAYLKFTIEKAFGAITTPVSNAVRGIVNLDWATFAKAFTSIKAYDTDLPALQKQATMRAKEENKPGMLDTFMAKIGFGPRSASAVTVVSLSQPTLTAMGKFNKEAIASYNSKGGNTGRKVGERYEVDGPAAQNQIYNMRRDYLVNLAKMTDKMTPDLLTNWKATRDVQYEIMKNSDEWNNKNEKQQAEMERVFNSWQQTIKPMVKGGPSTYSASNLNIKLGPEIDGGMRDLIKQVNTVMSKLAQIGAAGSGGSMVDIQRETEIQKRAIRSQMGSLNYQFSKKDMETADYLIDKQAEEKILKLQGRMSKVSAAIYQNLADAQTDVMLKIDYEQQAAIADFKGGENYKTMLQDKQNGAEYFAKWEDGLNQKYDEKRRVERTKQAEAWLTQWKELAKGEADATIAALEAVFKRGGMSIDTYMKGQLDAQTKQSIINFTKELDVFKSQLKAPNAPLVPIEPSLIPQSKKEYNPKIDVENIKNAQIYEQQKVDFAKQTEEYITKKNQYDLAIKNVDEYINTLTSAELDAKQIPIVYKKITDSLAKFKENGNIEDLQKTLTGLIKETNAQTGNINKNAADTIAEKEKLDKAVAELNQKVLEMRIQTATKAGNTPLDYDVKNFIFGKNPEISESKFGKSTTPYMKMGEDIRGTVLKDNLSKFDNQSATELDALNKKIPAEFTIEKGSDESSANYLKRIEDELTAHEEQKLLTTDASAKKIKEIKDLAVEQDKARNLLILEHEKQTTQMRIDVALGMANMIGQAASMLYEASGQKSKEAFYVMKAVAFAEAAIKGYSAVMTAYASGQAAGAPYAGAAVGAAYAAIAAAFVGVQLGMIAAQTVAGPAKKAEGGAIEGGSGHKDDVPIMAMGGEYVVKKASVKKYGASFMDALNKGLIPVSDMSFNIPTAAAPDYGQTHFADGGAVAGNINVQKQSKDSGTPIQVVNVIDPQLLDKYLASNQGQRTLVNVLAANKYEMQHIMR